MCDFTLETALADALEAELKSGIVVVAHGQNIPGAKKFRWTVWSTSAGSVCPLAAGAAGPVSNEGLPERREGEEAGVVAGERVPVSL